MLSLRDHWYLNVWNSSFVHYKSLSPWDTSNRDRTNQHTCSDNKVRELIAVKLLHTSLLNTAVVAFKVLPLGSYALMPAPSPTFKTILELVLWNGFQSCRCITPDVISVIKMPSFRYFLYFLGKDKRRWGLDPVNRQGVPTQLFVLQLKPPSQTELCEQVHCGDARSLSCWQTVRVVSVYIHSSAWWATTEPQTARHNTL